MNVNSISSIILGCGNNYRLPCKFLSGSRYKWNDYYYTSSAVTGKEKLTADKLKSDLIGNTFITALSLENCRLSRVLETDNTNDDEITNTVLNDIMCPNLIELDLRNTYVVDISGLNNVIKKTRLNENGRNLGTLRLNTSLLKDGNGEFKLVNLSSIQNVINGIDNKVYWYAGDCNGLNLTDFATLSLLKTCTDLTRINTDQAGFSVTDSEIFDLTSLTKLKTCIQGGLYFQIKLPNSITTYKSDGAYVPIFSEGTGSVNCTPSFIAQGSQDVWKRFFKSISNCSSITLFFSSNVGTNFDYLINEDGSINYDGGNCTKLTLSGGCSSFVGFCALTQLKSLEITNSILSSIFPLVDLVSLTRLCLNNNQILDLTGINSLTNLTTLMLNSNPFTCIAPLRGLNKLNYLELTNTSIGERSDYNGETVYNLDELVNLYKNGNLRYCYLTGCKNLKGIIEDHEILTLDWKNTKVW